MTEKASKTEVRVFLNKEELHNLDKLKELFSCLHRPQVIKMLIKMARKEIYEKEKENV